MRRGYPAGASPSPGTLIPLPGERAKHVGER